MELLTYRQLRRLEKLDRDKAREEKLWQVVSDVVKAGGSAAEGLFAGGGLAVQGLFSGDAVAFGVKLAAGYAFLQWLIVSYPNFARETHLNTLSIPGTPLIEEVVSNASQGKNPFRNDHGGKYCVVRKNSDGSYDQSTLRCYDVQYARDSQLNPPDFVEVNRVFNSDGTVTLQQV